MKKILRIIIAFLAFFAVKSKIGALTEAPVDITKLSMLEIADKIDKGYITSEQLVNIYLERIEQYDEMFNSINVINEDAINVARKLDEERTLGKVRSKIHGIPIIVKCNIDVHGIPTTGGTKALKNNYPKENAFAVQKLIDAGAIIIASANMSEMAFSAANSYSSYGQVHNAFNLSYSPYGSSGGSAVSIAASFAAASLGTDTNASVRIPASAANLYGMRPTLGLVSRSGVIPYDVERDTIGVMTKSIADNELLLSIINGYDANDSYTKEAKTIQLTPKKGIQKVNIGVPTQYLRGNKGSTGHTSYTDDELYDIFIKAIETLEKNGANIVYLDNFVKSSNITLASQTMSGITMCDGFNNYIKGTTGNITNFKQFVNTSGHVYSLSGYVSGCNGGYASKASRDSKKQPYKDYVNEYFEKYDLDVIIYPTTKNKAVQLSKSGLIAPGSAISSVIGFPSMSMPVGFDKEGFSYGLEILAEPYEEEKIYNVAASYELITNKNYSTTSLAPNLYTIPTEVIKLNDLYEKNYLESKYSKWLEKVKEYYLGYNTKDKILEAQKLLLDYDKEFNSPLLKQIMKKVKLVFYILVKIIIYIITIMIIYILYRYIRYINKKNKRKNNNNRKRK